MQTMTMAVINPSDGPFLAHMGTEFRQAEWRTDIGPRVLQIEGYGIVPPDHPKYPQTWKPIPGIPIGVAER